MLEWKSKQRTKEIDLVPGILSAVLAAFCFGIMPVISKFIYNETRVDPFFYLMIRYGLAAILIWMYQWFRRKRPEILSINRSELGIIGLTSICYITVTSAYFIGLQYIDASINSLLVFTFPVFTPFLGKLIFKQRLHWAQIVAAMVGFAGCTLLIGNYHLKGQPGEVMGLILGVISGLIYALYTLFGQKITVRLDPVTVTAYNILLVAIFFLILRVHWLWSYPQPASVYVAAAILAVISTILANTFYFDSIRRLGAVKAGIFSSIEPLFTAVLAMGVLGERMLAWQWAGAFFIFAGMIIIQQPWQWGHRS